MRLGGFACDGADKQMFPSLVMSPELSGHQDLPDFLKANTAAISKVG